MRRNFSWFHRFIAAWFILFVSIPVNTLRYILASESKHLKAYLDAILWNVTHKTKAQWKF